MTPARTPTYAAALSLLTATLLLPAQTATQTPQQPAPATTATPHPSSNRNNNLVLDAAHGGPDDGARIGDRILEKDLTLSLVGRIRAQLATEENLNLILTRDPDAGDPALGTQPPAPSIDSRAGIANHAHAFACILLHATAAGSGVHIVTSELPPPDPTAPVTSATPWSTAQAGWVRQSLRLANQVGLSLLQAGIPVYLTHASVRPLDSLTCPAIAIEVAPPRAAPSDPSRIDDPSYGQRISTAIASALIAWRNRPVPPSATAAPAATPSPKPVSTTTPHPTRSTLVNSPRHRPPSETRIRQSRIHQPRSRPPRPHKPSTRTDRTPPAIPCTNARTHAYACARALHRTPNRSPPMKLRLPASIADRLRLPPGAFDRLRLPSAIPRYQRILFRILVGGTILLTTVFLRGCQQAHDRLSAPVDNTPIAAPTSASEEGVPVLLADDAAGALYVATRQYALPQEPTTRARALIEHLLADYALPDSKHPLQTGAAVDDVFLLALPIANPPAILPSGAMLAPSSGRVAVINLRAAFVENHPSGIEVEDLTVRSIIGTLHSNIPDLTEVRFLVDGQPRETLAGHADLARTYPITDVASRPTQPSNDLIQDAPATQP